MTREKILAMNPGRELEVLVAERVMGWTRKEIGSDFGRPIVRWYIQQGGRTIDITRKAAFFYSSTDITAAFEVLKASKFIAAISGHYHTGWSVTVGDRYKVEAWDLPEAICKAVLLAMLDEKNE